MMLSIDGINDMGLIPICMPEQDEATKLPPSDQPELPIINGMSGMGRIRAADTLENLDWYVADNPPPCLLWVLTGVMMPNGGMRRFAVVADVRSRELFARFSSILADLKESGFNYRLLFLDCSDDGLVKQYDNARRPHPLQGDGRVFDGIAAERALLDDMRKQANIITDTSGYSAHDPARKVRALVADEAQSGVRVTVMFFGSKCGLPIDADNVVDVRFLSNPYWTSGLWHLTRHDGPATNFVLEKVGGAAFVEKYTSLILDMLQGYARELKPFVTFAVGCMGGKHRSVAIVEVISERLRASGQVVQTIHRDVGHE